MINLQLSFSAVDPRDVTDNAEMNSLNATTPFSLVSKELKTNPANVVGSPKGKNRR